MGRRREGYGDLFTKDEVQAFILSRYLQGIEEEQIRVDLKDHLLSRAWLCSSGRAVSTSDEPIPVPAPCAQCGGIAFETVETPLQ